MKTDVAGKPILTVDLIRSILVHEMELDEDRVTIYNQKFKIPKDDGMFALIGYKGSPRIISNKNSQVMVDGAYTEVQEVNTQELISVALYSRSIEALQRKEEMLMAMASIYAQQVQETHAFRINRLSPIEDLSDLEGSAQLYRFEISMLCFAWYRKTKSADYYERFTTELWREDQDPIAIDIEDQGRVYAGTTCP